ncbi:MAG: PAS domain S-box protein [Proteobacteria bacterium]|nr:PAS domain S-box protein [Pseudomonadota bacterium]
MGFPEDHLYQVLDKLVVASLAADETGKIVFANGRCENLFGYGKGELNGQSIEIIVPPALRHRHRDGFARYIKEPSRIEVAPRPTLKGLHRSGKEFLIDLRATSIVTDEGPRFFGTVRDVTNIRNIEDTLGAALAQLEKRAAEADASARSRAEQIDLFVTHVPTAVAVLDRSLNFITVSNRWLESYGMAMADVIGKNLYELFPGLPERWRAVHRRCLAGETLSEEEDPYHHPDGTTDWVRWAVYPWHANDGQVGGIIMFTEVITARKRAEQRLRDLNLELESRVLDRTAALAQAKAEAEAASAMKSWFITAAGHDLRQPLQASRAYLTALAHKLGSGEFREIAAKVDGSLAVMSDILDVLLDVGQLDNGTIKAEETDFRLYDLVHRVMASCQPQAAIKDLYIRCEGQDCAVRSDPAFLERILTNLVANAVRYTEHGGVTIGCDRSGDLVRIWVRDTGIGIPGDSLDRVFEDFVQLGNAARERHKGLGIGLSIARRIADLLGHRLSVSSIVGQGSTFTIELPAGNSAIPSADPAPLPAAAVSNGAPISVLLVDDDPNVSDSMAMVFEVEGMDVKVAASGAEALAVVEAGFAPAVIVSDYRLPDIDGFEVIRRIREHAGRDLPAFLLTGDLAVSSDTRPGSCTVLHKPFDIDALSGMIRRAGA